MNAAEALTQEKYFHDLDREALSAARAELAKWKDVASQIVPFDSENDDQIFNAVQAWLEKYEALGAKLRIAKEAFKEIGTWLCLMTPNGPCQGASPCPVCIAREALDGIRK